MKVLFLCPHGGAKSVMAAAFFNQLAEERALPFTATSAAAEDPYEAVPEPVAELLQRQGIDVRSFRPQHLSEEEMRDAAKVVAIGCEGTAGERWDDVPMAGEDLHGSASAIRRHVAKLVEE